MPVARFLTAFFTGCVGVGEVAACAACGTPERRGLVARGKPAGAVLAQRCCHGESRQVGYIAGDGF